MEYSSSLLGFIIPVVIIIISALVAMKRSGRLLRLVIFALLGIFILIGMYKIPLKVNIAEDSIKVKYLLFGYTKSIEWNEIEELVVINKKMNRRGALPKYYHQYLIVSDDSTITLNPSGFTDSILLEVKEQIISKADLTTEGDFKLGDKEEGIKEIWVKR